MLRFTSLLLTLALLGGCASKQLADQDALSAMASAKASELGDDSALALDKAQTAYRTATTEELAFYAPLHMQQLEAALKEAQQADLAGNSGQSIQASARVLTLLENGQKNKATARQLLAPVFKQKEVLDGVKAGNVLPGPYNDRMDDLKDLIVMIESGDSSRAQEKSVPLLTSLQELERDTMLALYWQPAAETLDKAEDEDADVQAPQTFAGAEEKVEQAEVFIRQHYHDRAQAEATGLQALRLAQHALFIAREAQKLQKLNAETAEQAALKQEDLLHQIATTAGAGDLRHMAFRDQTLAIIQYIQEEQRSRATRNKAAATAAEQAAAPQSTDSEATGPEAAGAEEAAEESDAAPADVQPAAETPAADEPAAATPAMEEAPATQGTSAPIAEPTATDPVAAGQSTAEQSATEPAETAADGAVTEQPAAEAPMPETPAADQAVTEQPSTEVPATDAQPAAEQPATDSPAAEEAAGAEAEAPPAEQPAETPAAEAPATEAPAAETPAATEQPAAEEAAQSDSAN